jgi:hypothetical protein
MSLPFSNFQAGYVSTARRKDPFHQFIIGYPKLAAMMELQPKLAIYRQFGALNAQNLLYYQGELIDLQEQLRKQQWEDDRSQHEKRKEYASAWYRLQESKDDSDAEQLDIVLKIRKLLKEYSELRNNVKHKLEYSPRPDTALIQQHTIHSYRKPAKSDLDYVQNFLQDDTMRPLALLGDDAEIYGSMKYRDSHNPDLVALCPRSTDVIVFFMWIARVVGPGVGLFRGSIAIKYVLMDRREAKMQTWRVRR